MSKWLIVKIICIVIEWYYKDVNYVTFYYVFIFQCSSLQEENRIISALISVSVNFISVSSVFHLISVNLCKWNKKKWLCCLFLFTFYNICCCIISVISSLVVRPGENMEISGGFEKLISIFIRYHSWQSVQVLKKISNSAKIRYVIFF